MEMLISHTLKEIFDSWGLETELNSLESILITIRLVLHDAELKQRKNVAINYWLRELKNAAYEAEDILDDVSTEQLKLRTQSERGKRLKRNHISIPSLYQFVSDINFPNKIVNRVKDVKGKLDAIEDKMSKFDLTKNIVDNRIGVDRQTSSLVNESEIYGRNDEKDMIVLRILGSLQNPDDLSVYVVCGMGGIGKTTLAQLVYNDERVKAHFELTIWVCVSDDFSIQRSLRSVIESMGGDQCGSSQLDPLQRHLQKRLRGKRFLLVLDDVWSEDYKEWDGLKETLRCGLKGSVVVVTTRIEKVAIMMGSISTYHLQYLSEDDSWSLFRRRAFFNKEGDKNLVEIGKEIVRKCGGVPLAVNALGSLMRFKSSEREWLAIQESEIWQLSDEENGILPALRLSYDNLPLQMRQCFAYCCIFPKDHEMEINELIQLWMENGFISSDGQKDLPFASHLIFKELLWRSFFQDVKKDEWGNTVCRMHDLMHDLAQSVMRHETFIDEGCKVPENPKMLRHLMMSRLIQGTSVTLNSTIDVSLRSLIMRKNDVQPPGIEEIFSSFLSKQQSLRVLLLKFQVMEKFQLDIVFKLERLRYLVLSCPGIESIPESLILLCNLQTLKLTNCDRLRELPKDLKYLKNLYFLEINSFLFLDSTPPELGELEYLQRLNIFIVGEDSSHQIHQLKNLDLGGGLTIHGLHNVRNFEDATSANLKSKKNLTSLSLSWILKDDPFGFREMEGKFDEVLDGLQPQQYLERLSIITFPGSRFPNWMSTLSFTNLNEINLSSCERCERLPPLGIFPSLTCLKLFKMNGVKRLDAEWHGDGESSFPALKDLRISGMNKLEDWTIPEGLNHFTSLEKLHIGDCGSLVSFPSTLLECSSSLKSLSIQCCEKLMNPLSVPLQRNSTLQELEISMCHEMERLPERWKQLSALKTLRLSECEGLLSLPEWLGSLQSLSDFSILQCNKLSSLPDGFRSLNSMRLLEIEGCADILVERCRKPNGEDWPKIHHIPQILINWETIQFPDI